MKIYLINPPAANGIKIVREGRCMQRQGAWTAVWAPISLAMIGSLLIKEGWEAKISDCIVEEIDFSGIQDIIKNFDPDLVVINAVTPSIESDLSTCTWVRKMSPRTITAAIGIHPTSLPEECLKMEPNLDYVIRGEPEITLKELAGAISEGKTSSTIEKIAGLSYRSGNKFIHEAARIPIADIDELPFPAWHLVDRRRYILPFTNKPFLLIGTSRGCPYPCNFCADAAFYGKKLRTRSPKRIVDELSWIKETFKIDEFLFWSESFTINRDFSIEVAEEILKRNLKISWVCNSRVDNVDKEMFDIFKKAGCWMIGYGIESGNQEILDKMKKGITVEQIKKAVIEAKRSGLSVTGHCVLGYPGETIETIKDTIRLTLDLPFDFVQYYCSVPFPGSKLYLQAAESGWITTNDWTQFEQNFSVMNTPGLSSEDVMRWRKKAYKQFYLRPKIILQTLRRIKNLNVLGKFINMSKDFLTWV